MATKTHEPTTTDFPHPTTARVGDMVWYWWDGRIPGYGVPAEPAVTLMGHEAEPVKPIATAALVTMRDPDSPATGASCYLTVMPPGGPSFHLKHVLWGPSELGHWSFLGEVGITPQPPTA